MCACDSPLDCPPVRAGADVVLLGAMDARVHAVRLSDGARLWDTQLGRIAIPSIHVFDGDTAVAGAGVKSRGRGVVALVNVADGSVGWTWNAPGTLKGPIDVTGSRVFCASIVGRGGEVTGIEPGRRRPLWRAPFDGWVTGVLVHEDSVFVPCMDHRLYCLDIVSGARRWSFAAHGLVYALPLVHRGALYFGAHDAVFYAVGLDGELLWRRELADRISGGAAADEGRIVFGGWDNHVRALDAATGEEQWAQDTGAPIVSTPLIANGRVYIGTDGGQLFSLDSHTGERLDIFPSSAPLDGEIKHAPLLAGQQLIVPAHDGAAYALTI